MSIAFRFATSAVLIASGFASVFANPVGKWQGHMEVEHAKAIAKAKPGHAADLERAIKAMTDARFAFSFKAGGTFTESMTTSGKTQGAEGTWTERGDTVTIEVTKMNGKPAPKGPPNVFKVSPNGRTMTFLISDIFAKMILRKQ